MKGKSNYFDIILDIVALVMIFHFRTAAKDWLAILCLWIFILYLMWYDIYAKNKKLAVVPLWLYLIGYYAVYWNEMRNIFSFLKNLLFGWII